MRDNLRAVRAEKRDEWEVRQDVETLKRARDIRNDPERLREAQELIQKNRQQEDAILGIKVAPPAVGRKNPATIMKL